MPMLTKTINRVRTTHLPYVYVLLVLLAFGLMALFSYIYFSGTERRHLRTEAYNALTIAQYRIESDMKELVAAMNGLSRSARGVILNGGSAEEMRRHLKEEGGHLFGENGRISGFTGVYGYFEAYGGINIHGGGLPVPEGFVAQERPWYTAAVEAGGKTVVTSPYISVGAGDKDSIVISYTCQILDAGGKQLGVIAVDALLDKIKDIATGTRLVGGYGFLVGDGHRIIAHPSRDWFGVHVADVDRGAEVKRDMEQEKDFFEYEIMNVSYKEEPSVLSYKRLSNGWYLGTITPRAQYYASVWTMMWVLIFWGATMALLLSAVLLNVTAAKIKADAKIHQADEYKQLFFDATPICCTLWDGNLRVINCNQAALNLFMMKDKEELSEKFLHMSPEFQPNGERSDQYSLYCLKRAFEKGILKMEWMHRLSNGDLLPCEVTLVRVQQGEDFLLVGYTRDLREYKEYLDEIKAVQKSLRTARDAAEAASKAKSIFLANMSHEIRTPLNSVIGFSELAVDEEVSPKAREYLGNITESAKWLFYIINDILDISKIEAGKMELEHIPFDLHDIFAHCKSVIMPKAMEKGITLYCYAEPSVGKRLVGDPVRLRQALINLLANAVKFTNVGTVKLLASIKNSGESSVRIYFEIKDSGIGMDAGQIERIFQPFMQADDSITRKYGGTGLGLAITKNIIEMMGGKLEVESTSGVGSKFGFEITFDAINETADMLSGKITHRDIKKPNFEGEILVCEDNVMNQQMIRDHLKKVGLESVIAENGKVGVDIIENRLKYGEKLFDLILMDVHMPVMDGMEAASKIAALGVKTPIVAVTANIMSNDLEHYRKNGIADFLGKPFTAQGLWTCLIKYLPVLNFTTVDRLAADADNEKMLRLLKVNFARNSRNAYEEIREALDAGDIKTAHRLAHSLKGNAGQIGEMRLREAAAIVENMLSEEVNCLTGEQLGVLEDELKSVLKELAPVFAEATAPREPLSEEEARCLFEKLGPMLANRNPECMGLLDDIRAIPGAEELAQLVDKFKFKQAIAVLSELKQRKGII